MDRQWLRKLKSFILTFLFIFVGSCFLKFLFQIFGLLFVRAGHLDMADVEGIVLGLNFVLWLASSLFSAGVVFLLRASYERRKQMDKK